VIARRWVAPAYGGLDVLREVEVQLEPPKPGEVLLEVRASGVNPIDYKILEAGDPKQLPVAVGFEAAGILRFVGPGTTLVNGPAEIGTEVLAYRISGGYASAVVVPGSCVFTKPSTLSFPEAANLLLVGTTAAEMLHVTGVRRGETILIHGASGSVGVSVLQQAKVLGARVIGTASERNFETVRKFGGVPVAYGEGLVERIRALAPGPIAAALDAAGTDEAIDASLALVSDRQRIVTIVAIPRAQREGFLAIMNAFPESGRFRDSVRGNLVQLAAEGRLQVPIARTFSLDEAREALELLQTKHPGGKLALLAPPGGT